MNVKIPGEILLHSLAGSHAYGLNTSDSDEDFRGVFVAHKADFYSLDFLPEVSDDKNDSSYFELSKFVSLLEKNNPTVIEYLNFPEHCILNSHPLFSLFTSEIVLSQKCQQSYLGYALGQIRKAYELKKRILFPENEDEKTALDFCEVIVNGEVIPFHESGFSASHLSASLLNESYHLYSLHKSKKGGLFFDENLTLKCSERGENTEAYMMYDAPSYRKYLRDYKSYYLWQRDRRNNRLKLNADRYDGKFLMHTFRLLYTAKDIATKGEIILVRPERVKLLGIRNHKFEFSELVKEAEDLIYEVRDLFSNSALPLEPNVKKLRDISLEIREEIYLKK